MTIIELRNKLDALLNDLVHPDTEVVMRIEDRLPGWYTIKEVVYIERQYPPRTLVELQQY
jgi:hypothetical protein